MEKLALGDGAGGEDAESEAVGGGVFEAGGGEVEFGADVFFGWSGRCCRCWY